MAEKSPTTLQIETLRLIRDGKVSMRKHGYAAFRISGATPSVVGRLVSMGLAQWPKGHVGEQTCELLPAGGAAIAKAEGRADG